MMINTSEEVSDKEYEDGECSRFKANKVRGQESRNKANYFIIEKVQNENSCWEFLRIGFNLSQFQFLEFKKKKVSTF